MDDRDRETIRKRLLEEREARMTALAAFDERARERLEMGDDELTAYPLHMADEGTDTMEREKEYLLASQEGRQLLEVDAALRMLYRNPDEFDACESCGRQIGLERFELVPWTRFCVDCQRKAEGGLEAGAEASEGAGPGGSRSDGPEMGGGRSDGERSDGERSDGERSDGERSDGERSDGPGTGRAEAGG